jgi:hypothetical protein
MSFIDAEIDGTHCTIWVYFQIAATQTVHATKGAKSLDSCIRAIFLNFVKQSQEQTEDKTK